MHNSPSMHWAPASSELIHSDSGLEHANSDNSFPVQEIISSLLPGPNLNPKAPVQLKGKGNISKDK